ncbi:MAG TPA: PIN domain-containing protein [Rhizobiaceae bacterium]|nr:PIN domain-containing protein [Rhizobiaceae bacterium]
MIGIDTNIILRLMLRDDERQYELSEDLIRAASADKPLVVNVIAATEAIWVLERKLQIAPAEARNAMKRFLGSPEIHMPPSMTFRDREAAFDSRHRGWSDVIIAAINSENGCRFTYTFDARAAREVPGMELLA